MTDQRALRQRIARLEEIQAQRLIVMGEIMDQWNKLVEKKQREIDNLKAQLTIGVLK